MQLQILATKSDTGYFCVKTISPADNFHFEEIAFDRMFVNDLIAKLTVFYVEVIIPELCSGFIKASMSLDHSGSDELGIMLAMSCTDEIADVSDGSGALLALSCAGDHTSSNIEDVFCQTCSKICVAQPQSRAELSIVCCRCYKWLHWPCAGINGSEAFLQNKRPEWLCKNCSA